jgi:hypothetical protein
MALTAIPGVTGDPPHWWGVAIGLGLLAFGTGGIKVNEIVCNKALINFTMFY